ncbi:MAG: FG-GAP-like repeat-containing protein [Abditibacteriales bacterium]|nr:FG-GAP-like repeat-containing protein [Abditibacteriales bacterium]
MKNTGEKSPPSHRDGSATAARATCSVRSRNLLTVTLIVLALTGCRPAPPPLARFIFTDVTAPAGIRFRHNAGATGRKYLPETMGAGCAFFDYDNDGWLDILLLNGSWLHVGTLARRQVGTSEPADVPTSQRPNVPTSRRSNVPTFQRSNVPTFQPTTLALYRNNRDGTFTDATRGSGLDVEIYAMGCCVGDYDNDGWEDVYITTAVGPNRLFRNTGKGVFVDETEKAKVGSLKWGTSCAWLDYDKDGWLDLFVCNYVQWTPATDKWCGFPEKAYCRPHEYPGETCLLYHNNRDGTFTDVSQKAGIAAHVGKSLGVVVFDFDRDGWEDLAVANDTEPTFLFRNNHDGTFREVAMETGVALSEEGLARAGMGIDAADVLNDGRWTLLIGNFVDEGLAFFREEAPGEFADAASAAGLYAPSLKRVTFGVGFVDFDNDGFQDAFAVNGHIDAAPVGYAQRMLFFRNERDGTFRDVTAQTGAAAQKPLIGRGAAWGDFDNDGDVDLLVTANMGAPRLLRNDTRTPNRWLRVRCRGNLTNRSGIGTTVTVKVGRMSLTRTVRSGSSYCSASEPALHFGLGAAQQVDEVEIRWTSGKVERLGPQAANQTLTVVENVRS